MNYFGNVSLEEALECVGEGWAPLIREVYEKKPDDVIVVQVKEKFGGLRVYTNSFEFDRSIQKIEVRSLSTCEWCGKKGTNDNRYNWLKTLCTACKRKRSKLKKEGK